VSDTPSKAGDNPQPEQIGSISASRPKERKKVFPEVLHDLLTFASEDSSVANIVMWLPSGAAFVIFEPQKFEQLVLPKFFPQSRYASFTRKLNRWGFRQISKGPDRGAFHHDLFRRDSPQMCLQMTCVKARKSPAIDDQARGFYQQSFGSNLSLGSSPCSDRLRIDGMTHGIGNFGAGSNISNNFGGFSNITTESLEEMLRNQQKALEMQRAKLNAQRALLENHAQTLRNASAGKDDLIGNPSRIGDEESAMLRAAGSSRNILQQMGHLTDMHQIVQDVDQFRDLQPSPLNNSLYTSQDQMRNFQNSELCRSEFHDELLARNDLFQTGHHQNLMPIGQQDSINSMDFQVNFPQHLQFHSNSNTHSEKEKINFVQDLNFDHTALLRLQYQQQMAISALQAKAGKNTDSIIGHDAFSNVGFNDQFSLDPSKSSLSQMINPVFSPEELYHLAAIQQQTGASPFGAAYGSKARDKKLEGGRAA